MIDCTVIPNHSDRNHEIIYIRRGKPVDSLCHVLSDEFLALALLIVTDNIIPFILADLLQSIECVHIITVLRGSIQKGNCYRYFNKLNHILS